jgi:methionine-gamma-lyase
MGPNTAVLVRGFDPSLSVGSVRPAVFRASTFVFSSPEAAERAFAIAGGRARREPGEDVELIYSRMNHPNAEILEDHLVPMEPGARAAAAFNSGMAAIATLFFALCRPGDAVVFTEPLYGKTHHMLRGLLGPFGVRSVGVPAGDAAAMEAAVRDTEGLRVVLLETPANPTLRMVDIAHAVRCARSRGPRVLVAVDNTFLGPVFQHPIALGADLAVYSATKFLAGFSDMLGGVLLGSDPEILRALRGMRSMLGTILQADECWLLDSRLPTVGLRMERQAERAERLVGALRRHPRVERIHYPTLFRDREQSRIFRTQCSGAGSLFSLELKGGRTAAFRFLRRLRVVKTAVSLGGMESLACHPASTTHSDLSRGELARSGVTDSLVRVSIGMEDEADLVRDFERALA